MDNKIIFKLIKTYGGYYVYDRSTNSILALNSVDYSELQKVLNGSISPDSSDVIKHYRQFGMFKPNTIKEILHPFTKTIEHKLNNCIEQLILQVTQQCNLRCSYCIYSGEYIDSRSHNASCMDLDTAKKAIDFFIKHSFERNQIHISFYGGEPLLNFDLIKQVVDYAKSCVSGKKVSFGITTNGTLLKGSVLDFLSENNFSVSISLDGPQEEHDRNRKFADGKGSFDAIMKNIMMANKRYPDFSDNIQFLTVINPKIDLPCVLNFFSSEEIFNERRIMYNMMEEKGLKRAAKYSNKYKIITSFEYLRLLFFLIGKIKRKNVSGMMLQSGIQYQRLYKWLNMHIDIPTVTHPGGPCVVGVQRLFVDTKGRFFPCERVSELQPCFNIGNLHDGFYIDRIQALLNNGSVTKQECKQCWNIQNCKICTGTVDFKGDDHLTNENKRYRCYEEKERVLNDFYDICVLHEMGFDMVEGIEI